MRQSEVSMKGLYRLCIVIVLSILLGCGEASTGSSDTLTADDIALSTDEDNPATGNLSASGPSGSVLTYHITSTPSKGSVALNSAETGSFVYTPASNANGSDHFEYRVSSGNEQSSVARVSITINPVNDAPECTLDSFEVSANQSIEIRDLTANDTDVDGDALTITRVTQPSHGTLEDLGNGRYEYTPSQGYLGEDSFTYRVDDSQGGIANGVVDITVTELSAAPVAQDLQISTEEDTPVTGNLSASDPNNSNLTFEIVTQPTHGTIDLNNSSSGAFLYTPDADVYGSDSFSYTASSATASSAEAIVDITISAVNDNPVAVTDSYTVEMDQSLAIVNLTVNDTDADGDDLTITQVTQPGHGMLVDNGDTTYTYTPTTGYTGNDSFNYTIEDGQGGVGTGDVNIAVHAQQSASQPNILFTDIVSGPNLGGENNNGAYLSLFGLNFGNPQDLGTSTHVLINNVEVADYKFFGTAKAQFLGSNKPIQMISVQVGALDNPSPGIALPIKIVVDSLESNTDHSFTIQPGDMIYVSKTGSDTLGDGSFENPYRMVQNPTKSNPAWTSWDAGDTIILRQGTWQDTGADNKFLRIDSSKDGSLPNGVAGNGYLTILGYPGETVNIDVQYSNGTANGGIVGPGSGFTEMANYVVIANLQINDDSTKSFGDGGDGPIYASASGLGWRIINNEVTARVGTSVDQRASGIGGGYRDSYIFGNYVHDIQGITSGGGPTFLNHGMYFDYQCNTLEIAYNIVKNVDGGNSIQWHGGASYSDVSVHHNLLDGAGKHGFNDNGLNSSRLYNNIVENIYQAGYRRAANNASNVRVYHNTFYNCNASNGGSYATWFEDAWQQNSGPSYANNIIVVTDGQNYHRNNTIHNEATTLSNNLYFGDGEGPSADPQAVNSDPLFANPDLDEFQIQNGSPAINKGSMESVYSVVDDFAFKLRDISDGVDIGAYEFQ